MFWQADLFDDDPIRVMESRTATRGVAKGARPRSRTRQSRAIAPEFAARVLEASDDYRVLRRLRPRAVTPARALAPGEAIAVIVDTETTGLDPTRDEIIEIGMVAFIYDTEGSIVHVIDTFSALHEPTLPISPEITRLTGITPDMVMGHAIDVAAVDAFIEAADLVIAHNAAFDRPYCERLARGFGPKAWACSVKEVDWAGLGYEGAKLGYLVGQCGWSSWAPRGRRLPCRAGTLGHPPAGRKRRGAAPPSRPICSDPGASRGRGGAL
ncbi:3'-5' exonuclease [Hyphomicrobiales bacterium BP6-180914]|uniref:3'-5' exonuclease n=1 Tax=Lichenifustis flavocetrariae TaxID=2949735 RepID=A0AA41Z8J4_9HYPH|nr:3'-5' exonuclease [Lichenifustis flavocetrariae]MCW6511322.1 3'-5' exonuclease [Lichenifustis flavocetrariae]